MDRQEQIEFILDHYENPRNRGQLDDADAVMRGGNPGCGDVVTFYLAIDPETATVTEVRWDGMGCTISQASASLTSEKIDHVPLDEIRALTTEDMVEMLGGDVVQSRIRCAVLPLQTVKAAVRTYESKHRAVEASEGVAQEDDSFGLEFETVEG